MDTNRVITGDCIDELQALPETSVHMCMTSPPYWNLRDYGVDGQLGLAETPEEYVNNIADVMDEVKRVLRDDGSLWLNISDTYISKPVGNFNGGSEILDGRNLDGHKTSGLIDKTKVGLPEKSKGAIPSRLEIELIDRGWIERSEIIWHKSATMPESVTDRLSQKHEKLFHFTKNQDYHFDLDSIKEQAKTGGLKNPGDVWKMSPKPFSDTHFAVYPPELVEKPIKATCPPDGVVLDPFAGAGTTLLKAKELGRDFLGIELNPEYADMARGRIGIDVENPDTLRGDESQTGLEHY